MTRETELKLWYEVRVLYEHNQHNLRRLNDKELRAYLDGQSLAYDTVLTLLQRAMENDL